MTAPIKHSMCKTMAYRTWMSMKQRCYNSKLKAYANYGGRGITVCDRWLESFENFYADMGDRPEWKSIDRIDNNWNYEPWNCKWSTNKEQSNNTRVTRKFDVNGEMMTAYDISKVIWIPQNKIISYFNKGYTIAQMVHFEERGINPSLKRVVKISLKTWRVIEIYDTALHAWQDNLITPWSISKCCRWLEHHNTAWWYKWEFYDEEKHTKKEEEVFNYSIIDDNNTLTAPLKYYICWEKEEYYLK